MDDGREPLLAALEAYAKCFPDEMSAAQQFIDFVNEYTDCFKRSLLVGHITGSAWVLNQEGTHALFTHHRKLDRWLQVGGHADGDADVAGVAMREAHEESGLIHLGLVSPHIFDIDAHTIPPRGNEPEHIHYDVRYLLQATEDESLQISSESNDLAWFSATEINAMFTDESILRMARKWGSIGAHVVDEE